MGFISICNAVYDYQPQSDEELELKEGELLFILESEGGDDWWRARKKAVGDDEDEPEGLVPNNYVEDAKPISKARALYDYTRQTDEEVSFSEDAALDVYDISDPDWTLVGISGEFGFAPANYIEVNTEVTAAASAPVPTPRPAVQSAQLEANDPTTHVPPDRTAPTPAAGPAADLARVLGAGPATSTRGLDRDLPPAPPAAQQLTPELSDEEEAPALPRRPPSQTVSSPPRVAFATNQPSNASNDDDEPPGVVASPPYTQVSRPIAEVDTPMRSPGGFHLYNISEMVSVMGRRKKMPTTLGINVATGTIMLSPEKKRDGPTQEWSADKLTHYSLEGKHVFLELIRPSKSLDLHAGAKDTAQEIVSSLGDIAGVHRAEGFREVIAAAAGTGGQKKGVVLYDFVAQGDDEVTVAVGDEVIILDDEKSEEWWNIRRLKNGSEGVMPSSYIEVTGFIQAEPATRAGVNAGRSAIEQNRLEEERLAREAVKANRAQQDNNDAKRRSDLQLPQRESSLAEEDPRKATRKDKKKSSKTDAKSRSKPDPLKTRTWTDQSGSFKVDAQFIGIADGKIHLHKVNGVKIAVPVAKMSPEDLEYVEKVIQEPIEEHIPVADLIKLKRKSQAVDSTAGRSGASIEKAVPQAKMPEYDWFDFFLTAGVGPHQCERYAQAMVKDSMDETILPDITTDTLRAIGLKEGDALKVMKHLDQRFGRGRLNGASADSAQGGIFSGAGGALHNNTRRGRPETARQGSDKVDSTAFDQAERATTASPAVDSKKVPAGSTSPNGHAHHNGFDDDAWSVKPSSLPAPTPTVAAVVKPPSENMQALSLLDKPLEPTPVAPPKSTEAPVTATTVASTGPGPQSQPQQTGANPAFFSQVQQAQSQPQGIALQQPPRMRPQPPQASFIGSALLPPPPRPTSAPQNAQLNQFTVSPIQPQLTGLPSTARPTGPGQSLDELTAHRMQQQYLQAQQTGFNSQYGQYQNGLMSQPTSFQPQPQPQPQPQFMQPSYLTGNAQGSPFADPRSGLQAQPTGYGLQPGPAPGSLNSVLPPALAPQRTGYQPQMNGFGQTIQPQPTGFQPLQSQQPTYQQPLQAQQTGFGQTPQQNGFGNSVPPVPPLPHSSPAPLTPQKTGPAPNVKFGVSAAKKLAPQPTGRRANLANATPANPFGL